MAENHAQKHSSIGVETREFMGLSRLYKPYVEQNIYDKNRK